jgi:CRISPR-associated endonuclease/helicase Cas3
MTPLNRILARPDETLAAHTEQVLRRVDTLAALRPLPDYPRLWPRLRAAALLHDSGKLAAAFQRGLRSRGKQPWGKRHEVLSLAFLDWLVLADEDRVWVIAAIATHHRDATFIRDRYRSRILNDIGAELLTELDGQPLYEWYAWLFAQAVVPLHAYAPPTLDGLRRALGDLETWVTPLLEQGMSHPHFAEAVLLRGFMLQADHAGAAGVAINGALALDEAALQAAIGARPYPHQRATHRAAPQSALLLAPTGAGKTEAALLWATRTNAPRLFYMLPYRASMDAMARRLERFTPQVGLQHGRAHLSLYRRLLTEGRTPLEATAEAFAHLNLARLHAYTTRVFSPYHLLRAIYQFKGFEAALADCCQSALIVDEIHAYQPERLALVLGMLRLLREHFGVRLLIMTATLPPVVAQVLAEALPGLKRIRASRTTFAAFRRHRLRLREGDLLDALAEIQAAAGSGQGVLVVVNTVRRARQVSALLRGMGCDVLTLHGRFCGRDRWARERELEAYFGAGHTIHAGRPITVTTQVIEVSLDLDFDTCFTDPAPLDALLQRFGRVNRRMRLPDLADVQIFTQPTGADDRIPVYDPALVQSSLRVIARHDGQAVDERRLGEWLAAAYHDTAAWLERYHQRRADFQSNVLDILHAFESADDGLVMLFVHLFDEVDVLPESLLDEYEAHENPLEAASLLVSISYRHLKMLESQERVWPGEDEKAELFITSAAYSAEDGLQLEQDGDE